MSQTCPGSNAAVSSLFTLTDILAWRSTHTPDSRAYTFLLDGEDQTIHLTYQELDSQARSIAAQLRSMTPAGQPALLLYPPGLDYIASLFGCLYAGVIAVPAYPPRQRFMNQILAIVENARPAVVLTTSALFPELAQTFERAPYLRDLPWMQTDSAANHEDSGWQRPAVDSSAVAFLQYTSGSTGTPKGVTLSHGNLMHNLEQIRQCFGHTSSSRGMIWLPPYHDMGLIGGILQPIYAGFPVTLMAPTAFAQRPLRWLQAISRYGATTSGGPNFAYQLCVEKIAPEERSALDLSTWQVAFNGAEPVRIETLERFAGMFEPCGFRREAFYPCYGLAEATLMVSGRSKTALPTVQAFDSIELDHGRVVTVSATAVPTHRTLVACGSVQGDQQVAIVDPVSLSRCKPDTVGEIWVAGASVAQGYWNQPQETATAFQAYLNDQTEYPFLRTGDLGFFHEGQLFIMGRLKDLIIIRGLNHFAEDIERTVTECHPCLRGNICAAFSVSSQGEEILTIVQEIRVDYNEHILEEVLDAVFSAIAEHHGLEPHTVVLVRAGNMPRTSSGKTQRDLCRGRFLERSLIEIARRDLSQSTRPANSAFAPDSASILALTLAAEPDVRFRLIRDWLLAFIAWKLGVEPDRFDSNKPLTVQGLDSLKALELTHHIEQGFAISFSSAKVLRGITLTELASEVLVQLRDHKNAALAPLARVTTLHDHELSFGQRAIWFLSRLAPENTAYNVACAFRIPATLNTRVMRDGFQALMERHPILRTTYHNRGGEPIQVTHERMPVVLHEEDASNWTNEDLDIRLIQEIHRPFDLENGPVLRVHLFSRASNEYVMLIAMHHLAADFWSLVLLLHELGILYENGANKQPTVLPEIPLDYGDYVRWQGDMLIGPEGKLLWEYWQKQLRGELPLLDLPEDKPRPAIQTYNGSSCRFEVDAEVTQQLRTLAVAQGTTLYTVLVAAFNALLYRYTGQRDILIGSPMAARNRAALANLVGYLANPVVLRNQLPNNPTFIELLEQMRQTVLGAMEHQDMPFPLLVDRLRVGRDLSRSPIFQVLFVMQKAHILEDQELAALILAEQGVRTNLGGLPVESMTITGQAAQFDLTLMMAETRSGILGSFRYNSDLFNSDTILRMTRHFRNLLEAISHKPNERLMFLPMMKPPEVHRLLVEWNGFEENMSRCPLIQKAIEDQVDKTPDAIALICAEESISYRELNHRANQLAHYLIGIGVRPEILVGVCADRSINAVIGILGILKAGGAYVAIDPSYPTDRIGLMLSNAKVPVLLTQETFAHRFSGLQTRVVCIDADWPMISQEPTSNPVSSVQGDNLAYVIYTSGSTGMPKGVMITHANLGPYIRSLSSALEITSADRQMLVASFAFAASVRQLFVPLTLGGSVVIATSHQVHDPLLLFDAIRRSRATLLGVNPSYWRYCLLSLSQLEAEQRVATLANDLRLIMSASEPLWADLPQEWYVNLDQPSLLSNMFGQTELTGIATTYAVPRSQTLAGRIVPVGRPIPGMQAYILDQEFQPVPVGVVGELYFGGSFLARGYLHQPEATAESFIPNPFGRKSGSRLYRTGDLARYLPSGDIEHLGRSDNQLKVRGYRVEPGEIESHLREHSGVQEAAVIDQENARGDKFLVAYFVPKKDVNESPTGEVLRDYLRKRLPSYMIPSIFRSLNALPTNPNGKLDRRQLPRVDRGLSSEQEALGATPATEMEEVLKAIWCGVLGLQAVSVTESFFELGGTSLSMVRVHDSLCKAFRRNLPIVKLFEYPTIRSLAEFLEGDENLGILERSQSVAARRRERLSNLNHRARRPRGMPPD